MMYSKCQLNQLVVIFMRPKIHINEKLGYLVMGTKEKGEERSGVVITGFPVSDYYSLIYSLFILYSLLLILTFSSQSKIK